jgi:hypothetical protein
MLRSSFRIATSALSATALYDKPPPPASPPPSSTSSLLTLAPKTLCSSPPMHCQLTIMDTPVTLPFPNSVHHHPLESDITPSLQHFMAHEIQSTSKSDPHSDSFLNAKIDLLASTTFPYIEPFDDLMICAKWLTFLFYHDDYVEKLSIDIEDIEKLHTILMDSIKAPFHPLSASTLETLPLSPKEVALFIKIQKILLSIFQDLLNDDFQASAAFPYFKKEVQQYLDSTIQELRLKSQLKSINYQKKEIESQLLSLNSTYTDKSKKASFNFIYYLHTKKALLKQLDQINQSISNIHNQYNRVRLGSGSVDSLFMLGATLTKTQNVWSTPTIKPILDAINLCVCYSNDLFSLQKEMKLNQEKKQITAMNKVFIYQSQGSTLEDAIDKVQQDYHDQYQQIYSMLQALPPLSEHETIMVNIGLCWLNSNFIWSILSKRYPGVVTDTHTEPESLSVVDTLAS